MKKLTIYTKYHEAAMLLLMHLDLVESYAIENIREGLAINYPNDLLSQEFTFWLALAQGCGLVDDYQFSDMYMIDSGSFHGSSALKVLKADIDIKPKAPGVNTVLKTMRVETAKQSLDEDSLQKLLERAEMLGSSLNLADPNGTITLEKKEIDPYTAKLWRAILRDYQELLDTIVALKDGKNNKV